MFDPLKRCALPHLATTRVGKPAQLISWYTDFTSYTGLLSDDEDGPDTPVLRSSFRLQAAMTTHVLSCRQRRVLSQNPIRFKPSQDTSQGPSRETLLKALLVCFGLLLVCCLMLLIQG
jgi:hypothetical protein